MEKNFIATYKGGLGGLPVKTIVIICQHLSTKDIMNLGKLNKKMNKIMTGGTQFDGIWVINSFQSMFSKTGYTGIRNHNLLRLDRELNAMHYQTSGIKGDCLETQARYFKNWVYSAFILMTVVQPVLLIIKFDFGKQLSLMIMMSPATLSWIALIVLQIASWCKISAAYKLRVFPSWG